MISAKGTNGTIHVDLDTQTILIERTGLNARMLVGGGEKRIPLASVTAVQWRKAGITTGFLQLTLAGGIERRSRPGQTGGDAKRDENTLTFHARQQPDFERVRSAIDAALAAGSAPQPAAPAAGVSVADELAKLDGLRTQGIITDADFEAGKARILGL
jgi:hypothetical protein